MNPQTIDSELGGSRSRNNSIIESRIYLDKFLSLTKARVVGTSEGEASEISEILQTQIKMRTEPVNVVLRKNGAP
jgi:hypothetical protein